jgi:N-acyl-D-amino-acid deacylase
MGTAARAPARRELSQMKKHVERSMREGAVGLSTGLIYIPGAYAKTAEIVELARVAAARGGVYSSHMRGERATVFDAVREAATVGKKAGIRVQASHLKTIHRRGVTRPDRMARVLELIRSYRQSGVEITYDSYPYQASCTSLAASLLPTRLSADGKLAERLQSKAVRRRTRAHARDSIMWTGSPDRISLLTCPADPSLAGKTLADASRTLGKDPVEAAFDLIMHGDPICVFHSMRAEDVAMAACGDDGMTGSDGGVVGSPKGIVHPRRYGTFPRVLRVYVRELRLMTLEQAVRRMTSLPARKMGFGDRGLIAPGMKADLVIFDPKRIADRATFEKPRRYPVGIQYVIVNGHIAWDGKKLSTRRRGSVIRR